MSGIHVKKNVRNFILIVLIYQISLITPAFAIINDTIVDNIGLDTTVDDTTNNSSAYLLTNGSDINLSERDRASYVPDRTVPTVRVTDYNRYLTLNTIPIQRVSYSFEVDNAAIGTVESNSTDLSVINMIPDGIDQTKIYWSVSSNMGGFKFNSSRNKDQSIISNGTKQFWKDDAKDIEVIAYSYNNGYGTIITFNMSGILKSEVLTFNVNSQLNDTYYNGQKIRPGIMIIDISAKVENPFSGLSSYTPLPPTIILSNLTPGVISLY